MSNARNATIVRFVCYLSAGAVLVGLATAMRPSRAAAIPFLSDTPIASTKSDLVKPNVMLLMDTSKSMAFTHMPDEMEGGNLGAFPIGYKSYQCNILYYNPHHAYVLPKNSTGANLPAPVYPNAFRDVYDQYSETAATVITTDDLTSGFQAYTRETRENETVDDPPQQAYYYVYKTAGDLEPALNFQAAPCTDVDAPGNANRAFTIASAGGTWTRVLVSSLDAAQKENFAIWYSYYRTRLNLMKAALSLSFLNLGDSLRVGLLTVRPYADLLPQLGDSVDGTKYQAIKDFTAEQRREWYAKLFAQKAGGASPAREALARVGRHYAGRTDAINRGMGDDPVQFSCQPNFTIMTTDGYWNVAAEMIGPVGLDGATWVGQQDGQLGKTAIDPNTNVDIDIVPRPVWDGNADKTREVTSVMREYMDAACFTTGLIRTTARSWQSSIQRTATTSFVGMSTERNLQSTVRYLESTKQTLESVSQITTTRKQSIITERIRTQSTYRDLESTRVNLQTTSQQLQSTYRETQSTFFNLRSTSQTLMSTEQWRKTTRQLLAYDSATEQRTPSASCTPLGTISCETRVYTDELVAACTPVLPDEGNLYIETACTAKRTGQTPVQTCTEAAATSANDYTRTICSTVKTDKVPVPVCTAAAGAAGNAWTTTTCAKEYLSVNQVVATCAPGVVGLVETECGKETLTDKVPVAACNESFDAGTGIHTACTTAASANVPVLSCTPAAASALNAYTTTCPAQLVTTDQPVASCVAQVAAAGNGWLQRTCSKDRVANDERVASCTVGLTADLVHVSCAGPVVISGPRPGLCPANPLPTADNGYVETLCSMIETTEGVQNCTGDEAPTADNGYTQTLCGSGQPIVRAAERCTEQVGDASNSWVTITCPAPNITTDVPVPVCAAQLATASNDWTSRSCRTDNVTTDQPVDECHAGFAGGIVTTCSKDTVVTNQPVGKCEAGIDPVTHVVTKCATISSTQPVAACEPQVASLANGWVTRSCPPPTVVAEHAVAPGDCHNAPASEANDYKEETCRPEISITPTDTLCPLELPTPANGYLISFCVSSGAPGLERRTRVATTKTTTLLSGDVEVRSLPSSTTYDPPFGWFATDGICYPAGTIPPLPEPTPLTLVERPAPPKPADTATTTYTYSCSDGSWPCTLVRRSPAGSWNSLADVAQYYYVTDLRSGRAWDTKLDADPPTHNDNVAPSGTGPEDDKVPWQHMTTFTIGLGVSGTLGYTRDYRSNASGDFAAIRKDEKSWPIWPDPAIDYSLTGALYNNPKSIDDFWHTAVNGRGRYFNARDPSDVVVGLRDALKSVEKIRGAGSVAAVSNPIPTKGDNVAFIASYETATWTGDLEAREIGLADGKLKDAPLWRARPLLDARAGKFCDDRRIYVFHSDGGSNLLDFKWDTGTCSSTTVAEESSMKVSAGVVTAAPPPAVVAGAPTAMAQTGAAAPRILKEGDTLLAGDTVTTSPGAVVTIEHSANPKTTLTAKEMPFFGKDKFTTWSQYGDMSDGSGGLPDQRSIAQNAALVNFVRGQRGHEGFLSGDPVKVYRKRDSVLGDFVNAQPVYVKRPFASYTDAGYKDFKTLHENRKGMVYAAANDGMLHAFYAGEISVAGDPPVTTVDPSGGKEAWAFIPSMVLDNLHRLANEDYANNHVFLVDGTPAVGDVFDAGSGDWKTLLVGGLNKGGKGYYALDVTNPEEPKGLWEFRLDAACFPAGDQRSDCHLGFSFGKPLITKLQNGEWVVLVTSGYENDGGGGYLYVLKATTGRIIAKIATGEGSADAPSGLAQINNFVDRALIDNTTKFVYGGDNGGNVWRFDINQAVPTATRIGITRDAEGTTQPITTRPELAEAKGRPWVLLGTGRLLGVGDLTDPHRQAMYGFVADAESYTPTARGLRDILRPLSIEQPDPAVPKRTVVCTGDATACARPDGWVLDLPEDGERVNIDPALERSTLVFASNVPRNTACAIGGHSWLNFVDFRSGLPVDVLDNEGNHNRDISHYLGEALAVGVSIVRLRPGADTSSDGKPLGLVRHSTGENRPYAIPVTATRPLGKRVSWREVIR